MTVRRPAGPEEGEWRLRAACRGADPGLFFSVDSEPAPSRRSRALAAKAVCARCPVLEACHAHAMAAGESHGVWGGRTAAERGRLHRQTLRTVDLRPDVRGPRAPRAGGGG